MIRFVPILLIGLAGCDMPQPQPLRPSPAMQKILESCEAGNLEACTFAEKTYQQEMQRRASIPPPVFQPYYQNPADFQTPQRRQTVCRNSFGQVICETS
ncbi:MAG TPA: hypothetical protein DIU10_18270 [Sulfitobacter sp.]|nr:hypothetical protein [Sulfitobacter sp.]